MKGTAASFVLVAAIGLGAACGGSTQSISGAGDAGPGDSASADSAAADATDTGSPGEAGLDGPSGNEAGPDAPSSDASDAADSSSKDSTVDGISPRPCDPSCALAGGTCVSGTCTLTDNMGGVAPGTITTLQGGGSADPSFKFLYPYDATVLPGGLAPPLLQFAGASFDAAYVHVSYPGLDYKGYFGAATPPRIRFAQAIWNAITSSTTGLADVKVEVTQIAGGQVTGPITETWTLAPGSLRGTIYFSAYDSPVLGGTGSLGILQLRPGAVIPTVLKSGCGNVCHSASSSGSTLAAAATLTSSATYDLGSGAATLYSAADQRFVYGGLYPDGSFLVSATDYRTWLSGPSHLYDTKTGAQIPTPSWDGVVTRAGTPSFSHDGSKIVFNAEDTGGGHTLATMSFAAATKTFSNLGVVATDASSILGWPAFTPDDRFVLYQAGSNAQFETDSGAVGDLFVTDVSTATPRRLDALDGYAGSGSYLPASDPDLNFEPSMLPEAVGGYFWVVFTSHRSYGNTLPSMDGPAGSPDEYGKLWVAAIDIDPTSGADPSHPAFYLDGQEDVGLHHKGAWVFDACHADGAACGAGDECCGGFCRGSDGGMACSSAVVGCSRELETCTTAADCCAAGALCIDAH